MMMMRLTTMAITGRRMKRSVKLELCWTGDSLFMGSSCWVSAVDRRRNHVRRRGQRVVDHDRLPVPELERAIAHDGLAALEPVENLHVVTPALAEADELLL